jgi:hypothetical protein
MVVDPTPSEPATIELRKAQTQNDEQQAKKRRFEETKRRIQELKDSGELKFDPNGVDDGTNERLPRIDSIVDPDAVTRLRNEYLRRSRNA